MAFVVTRLIFVSILILHCIVWSQSRYGQIHESSLLRGESSLIKRISYELLNPNSTEYDFSKHEKQCRPLAFPTPTQCKHVKKDCPISTTVLSIEYLRHYFCTDITLRPLAFTGLLVWLIFLFSTLGISASDFFTPNLATIAQLLGLDENVAGVTFLAFGNGSPDVFSTFSAMRAGSGSLAIGELLGAASFIVSCVVGSMCIIKPFEVRRGPFLRDVGFFTAAVALLLVILWDGNIRFWEAGIMVGMYVFYVLVVVVGSWMATRNAIKRKLQETVRGEYDDRVPAPGFEEPYRDDRELHNHNPLEPIFITTMSISTQTLTPMNPTRTRAISTPVPPRLRVDLPQRSHSREPSPNQSPNLPSFSLLGALEFRHVVASLEPDAAGPSLSMFDSPVTPYARPRSLLSPIPQYPSHNQLRPHDYFDVHTPRSTSPIPSILHTPASPTVSNGDTESHTYIPLTRKQHIIHILKRINHVLFPSLHEFQSKSVLGQIASVFATPAILLLTITLPVVVTPYETSTAAREKIHVAEGRLVEFEEEGVERALVAEQGLQDDLYEMSFNKWLMAVQCTLGPLFCVAVLFHGTRHQAALLLAAAVAGLTAGILVAVFGDKGDHPTARMARCSMGFIVAIVWIMAIADEVVNVLQTFGFIFGLSDAIIGLTIFAVGNSLADLVANMSVAVFAPIMGFSACFGGPMLNILLGVGFSGSYITHHTAQPYELHFSTTLLVSTIGLLTLLGATLVFVPLNNYFLSRKWGILLIASYTAIMGLNVVVELKS
ncbi:Sodium/calcium exchanger protein-domain-containing protein [Infundibulicybe gibba]|nr:Sodium/calcium exchanger protein-domain-containing protein [Infundibulicybe gibba]